MRKLLGGIAAFSVGASLIVSCGGGGEGDSIDGTGNTGVVGAKSAGGATGNAGGSASSSSATGAAGTTAGTTSGTATTGSAGAAGATADAAGATGTATGATATATTPATTATTATTATGATPAATTATTGATATAATPAATSATTAAPAATAATATTTGSPGATIVPLYTSPSDPSWNTVIAAKAAHPKVGVIAVVNPANGPGASADAGYASGIARLKAAGIKVLGYVATGYAVRNAATVKADIDRWQSFYPGQIGGIFFDEQSNKAGDVAHYRELSQYAKSHGMSFTVGNPGTDTSEAFVGALDVMLIYESAGLPSATQLGGWHANHAATNFGVIPYATTIDASFVRSARQHVGYIYLQNDTLPNPWDSVPGNFGELLAALE